MGEIIDLSKYKARRNGHPPDGIRIEVMPPIMIVRHYRNGILTGEERVISERLLRDMLD